MFVWSRSKENLSVTSSASKKKCLLVNQFRVSGFMTKSQFCSFKEWISCYGNRKWNISFVVKRRRNLRFFRRVDTMHLLEWFDTQKMVTCLVEHHWLIFRIRCPTFHSILNEAGGVGWKQYLSKPSFNGCLFCDIKKEISQSMLNETKLCSKIDSN